MQSDKWVFDYATKWNYIQRYTYNHLSMKMEIISLKSSNKLDFKPIGITKKQGCLGVWVCYVLWWLLCLFIACVRCVSCPEVDDVVAIWTWRECFIRIGHIITLSAVTCTISTSPMSAACSKYLLVFSIFFWTVTHKDFSRNINLGNYQVTQGWPRGESSTW